MFRPRHIRSLLGGFVVAICAIALLATARSFLLSPRHIFPDGTVLQFEKITWGKRHVFSGDSRFSDFVREKFPSGFPLLFPGNSLGVATTTSEPSVVLWLLHGDPKTGQGVRGVERFVLVSDEHGRVFQNEIRGWGELWPNRFVTLLGYPKTYSSFPVIIADAELRPIWQVTVNNPHPIRSRDRETAAIHNQGN